MGPDLKEEHEMTTETKTEPTFEELFADGEQTTETPADPALQLREQREQRDAEAMKAFTDEFARDETTTVETNDGKDAETK
jgi:hypothetical protein